LERPAENADSRHRIELSTLVALLTRKADVKPVSGSRRASGYPPLLFAIVFYLQFFSTLSADATKRVGCGVLRYWAARLQFCTAPIVSSVMALGQYLRQSGVVEFVRERRCAHESVLAQTASVLELAEQQRVVPVKLASIDMKLVHTVEQNTAVEEIACRSGRIVVGGFRRKALGSARDLLGTRSGVARTHAVAAPVQNRGQNEWTFFLGRHLGRPLPFNHGQFCAARAHAALT
jgi:hypothetical protein